MKFTQMVKRSSKMLLAASVLLSSVPVQGLPTVSAAEYVVAANAVQGRNVRNLNLTPGANVSEMRFTWHSGHNTGAIRIWPEGRPEEARTINTTNVRPVEVHAGSANMGTAAANTRTATRPGFSYFLHQTAAGNLTADTVYEYQVIHGDFASDVYSFRTGGNERFQFAIGGDPQIGVQANRIDIDGRGWNNTLEVATRDFPELDFILSVGDQINTRTNQLTMSQQAHDALFDVPELNSLPLVPVVGNHDGSGGGNNNSRMWPFHYNLPMDGTSTRQFGTQFYTQFDYYFTWGDTLFLVLDTNTQTGFGPNGERTQFIEGAINRNPDASWVVATFHHAAYPIYRDYNSNAAIRNLVADGGLVRQLERLGVDIVLSGHEHVYSRSHHILANTPQLNQQWLNADAQIVSDPTGLNYNGVLDPNGLVHISVNSSSGSGYRGVRRFPRSYVAVYNQNWRRNVSVATVTPYKFSVATYQINDDSSRTLVDVYTIVRSENGAVPANVTAVRQANEESFTSIYSQVANTVAVNTVADLNLPERVIIETNIHNNDFLRLDLRDINGTVAVPHSVNRSTTSADYGHRVVPMYAAVDWDLSNITGAGTFEVTGTLNLDDVISGRVNVGVWNRTQGGQVTNQFPAHANAQDLRTISVNNTNNLDTTITVQVTVGQGDVEDPTTGEDAEVLEISYFGAEFNFFGRTNAEFLYDAFNPEVFSQWQGQGATPIGFGSPHPGTDLTLAGGTTIPTGTGPHLRNSGGGVTGVHRWTYFARTFYLPEYFNAEDMGAAFGTHRLDDNMVLFINGIEVYRTNTATGASGNVRIGQPINWSAFAGHNTNANNRTFAINEDFEHRNTGYATHITAGQTMHEAASRTNLERALQPGQNVLTAVVGNNSATSSDLWFDLEFVIEFEAPEAEENDYLDIQYVISLFNSLTTPDVATGFVTNYNAEDFTAESWAPFYQAVRGAFELIARYANAPHQRPTVQGYFDRLVEAHEGLVVDTGYTFNQLIAFAAVLAEYEHREADFTPASWAVAFEAAVQTLEFINNFTGTRAQQLQVRDIYRAVRAAHAQLELVAEEPVAPTPTYPEWTANTAFNNGDRVVYDGRVFEAQWLTQGQNPANSGPFGAWMEIGTPVYIGGEYAPTWTATRVFNGGDVVVYNGQVFRASFWTLNQSPTTPWGPWVLVGNVAE